MDIDFLDGVFDPARPDLWRGDPAEWTRRADQYLAEQIRKKRAERAALNILEDADDLTVMFLGRAEDSGTCTLDGVLSMDSEREALIEKIESARSRDVRTGLGGL